MRDLAWLCLLASCSFDPSSAGGGGGGVLGGAGDPDAAPTDELLLAAPGSYTYDADRDVLRHEGGPPIPHVSATIAGARRIIAGRITVGAEAVLRVSGASPLRFELVAGDELELAGGLIVGGAGGAGGIAPDGAGAPGGDGGALTITAPVIRLAEGAVLAANGGGGGEGAADGRDGHPGEDAPPDGSRAHGGRGATRDGGDGGDGTADRDAASKPGKLGEMGGGAGGPGGGPGTITFDGAVDDAGARISPAP